VPPRGFLLKGNVLQGPVKTRLVAMGQRIGKSAIPPIPPQFPTNPIKKAPGRFPEGL
jgi:hypothetical protein